MVKTAVVILNYNGKAYLEKFLPTVLSCSEKAEVIVADNFSTDESIPFLKGHFPEVRLIELDKNYGFAGGYNKALSQIKAEYYLLLNSDVEVSNGWLGPLEKFLDENPDYAACQPKIKDFNNRKLFEYAGACGGFIDFLGYPYCRGRIFDSIESDENQYDDQIDIFWASGASMMVRSDIFRKVGGLDKDFFAHMEEIDLCWRIHSCGYKIKAVPESVIYHVGGGTLAKSSPFKTYLNFRNGLYLLLKNLPIEKLLIKFPARIILDWVAAIKFLFEGNIKHSFSVIKAHFSVLRNLIKTLNKRNSTSKAPRSRLMIFEYYFKQNKKFSKL